MAKHRKTRQEKMVADQRHILYHLETNSAQASIPSEKKSQKSDYKIDLPQHRARTVSYAYVGKDLKKTTIVTASIIFAQIFLFIILNQI